MKVMTILGTRPEIIRLSRVIPKLDSLCSHILVHTGQNYDDRLNDIFFKELGVRQPDYCLGVNESDFSRQIGKLLPAVAQVILGEKPDKVLILGDTNSGLTAIIAKRMGIPVFHMEAGNRCFDDRVPEEVNRRIIDHCSDILMPYTERSRTNLLREGIESRCIYVIGNPIYEVVEFYSNQVKSSKIINKLGLKKHGYFLVTAHRSESVDNIKHLQDIVIGLEAIQKKYELPVIYSLHPHTSDRMRKYNLIPTNIRLAPPFGFFDFIALEQNALCVITDSGTVQEECSIFKIPNITIRGTTERPETIECGSNILAGIEPDGMVRAVAVALEGGHGWNSPVGYQEGNVSSKVVKIVLSPNKY